MRNIATYLLIVALSTWVLLRESFLAPKIPPGVVGTKFVVMGHLYPILGDGNRMRRLYRSVRAHQPDYVFILGDSRLNVPGVARAFREALSTEVYFVPGNHEVSTDKGVSYLENVGYLEKKVEAKDIRFLLIDSSASAGNINQFVKKATQKAFPNGPTVVMSHHRIWDDTLLSAQEYGHDKSYYFEDIYPSFDGVVKYIFSGNSKRQYFRDRMKSPTFGKQNLNNLFWCDKVGSVLAYSCGMGDGVPRAAYTVASVVGQELMVTGDYMSLDAADLIPGAKVDPDTGSHIPKPSQQTLYNGAHTTIPTH